MCAADPCRLRRRRGQLVHTARPRPHARALLRTAQLKPTPTTSLTAPPAPLTACVLWVSGWGWPPAALHDADYSASFSLRFDFWFFLKNIRKTKSRGSTEGVRWKGYPSKLLHAAAFRVAKTPRMRAACTVAARKSVHSARNPRRAFFFGSRLVCTFAKALFCCHGCRASGAF